MITGILEVLCLFVVSAVFLYSGYWWRSWPAYHKRVIYDRDETSPYLTRYYLIGRPKMPDGSAPFDELGRIREGAVWPRGWGLYIHCFHRSDNSACLHSHPWKWALSWVLKGGYSEERRVRNVVVQRDVRPGHFNLLKSDTFHRVDLHDTTGTFEFQSAEEAADFLAHLPPKPCWSLFLAGPKFTSWGFWDRETGKFTPWREYLGLDPKLPEDY